MFNVKRGGDHWYEDKTDDMLFDFCNDTMVYAAMKLFLGIPEETVVDEYNMGRLFDELNQDTALQILSDYIEHVGKEPEFNVWYENTYCEDEDDDWNGNEDDIDFPIYATAGRC